MGYGYGLGVRCPREGSAVSDIGWGGAAGALCAVDRTLGYSLFYLQHALGSPYAPKRMPMLGDLPFAKNEAEAADGDARLTY